MRTKKGTHSRLWKLRDAERERQGQDTYEVIRKDGIRFLKEEVKRGIKRTIGETLRESFKENYEAQDILLFEGEKPEIKVKGIWQVLEQCSVWEQEHFNYFLFNMANMSTKDRDGVYHIGKEYVTRTGGRRGTSKIDYLENKVDIRSRKFIEEYNGDNLLDTKFFHDLMQERGGSYDFSLSYGNYILRCHIYSVFGSGDREVIAGLAIRAVPKRIPKLKELNLPDKLEDITEGKGGLFLVSGRTGDGKSTTVASLVNKYNKYQSKRHVITIIEDPIEFVHKSQNARIIQRRVGENVPSYARATNDSLRESSDVVVLGELRTKEEISNALRLAEVGKLVIATIHANSVAHTIDRFVGEFANETEHYRSRMLENLLGILHQNLIVYNGEQFPVSSMLFIGDDETRKTLREGNFSREVIAKLLDESDYDWAISQKDWFEERYLYALDLKDKLDSGEMSELELEDYQESLLKLLDEDARQIILGEK